MHISLSCISLLIGTSLFSTVTNLRVIRNNSFRGVFALVGLDDKVTIEVVDAAHGGVQ